MTREVNALYRIFDADGELLYVGITNNPRSRMMDHVRSKGWARRIGYITFEHYNNRDELVAAERKAIAAEGPTFNVSSRYGEASDGDDDWEIEEYDDPTYGDIDRTSFEAAAEAMGKMLG